MSRSSNDESDDEELSSSEENYKHNGKSQRQKKKKNGRVSSSISIKEEQVEEDNNNNNNNNNDNDEDPQQNNMQEDDDYVKQEEEEEEEEDENEDVEEEGDNNQDNNNGNDDEEDVDNNSKDDNIQDSRLIGIKKEGGGSESSSSSSSTNNNQQQEQVDPVDLDALTNLIVHNIPKHFTNEDLKDLFDQFGEISSYKVVANRKITTTANSNNQQQQPQSNMGYGFVKFVHSESAAAAIESMNGHQIDSKTIKVSYATPTSSQSTHANLYINRLEPHITKEDLAEAFSKFGELVETRILMDLNTNTSRCVGFVHFSNRRDALSALSAMNGANIPQQSTPIYVKFADQKDDNKKKVKTRDNQNNNNHQDKRNNPLKQKYNSNSSVSNSSSSSSSSSNIVNINNMNSSSKQYQQNYQNQPRQQQHYHHQPQPPPISTLNPMSAYQYMEPSLLGNMMIPTNPYSNQSMYMYPTMTAPTGGGGGGGGGGVYRNTANPPQRYDPIGRNLLTNQYHHPSIPASSAQSNPYTFSYYPPQIAPIQTQLLNAYNSQAYVQQPQPPQSLNYSLQYSVHVSNLPNNADEAYIYKLFGSLGAIASVKMLGHHQAIINYLTFDAAQNAIISFNGKSMHGKTLKVKSQ